MSHDSRSLFGLSTSAAFSVGGAARATGGDCEQLDRIGRTAAEITSHPNAARFRFTEDSFAQDGF